MATELVGREDELAAVEGALDAPRDGPTVVVVEGEPGIGKSTMLQHVIARRHGLVLSARAVDSEVSLAFTTLDDLLSQAPPGALLGLPAPQQAALDAALLRADDGSPVVGRVIGAATHRVLAGLAERGPITLVIDDVQWVDQPSAAALAYALRRLDRLPVCVVVAIRTGEARGDPLAVDHAYPVKPRRVRLGPLSVGALFHVIRDRTGHVFPRPTLVRITDACGGNPLFAIELALALADLGATPGPGEPLPVPDDLAGLLAARLDATPSSSDALMLALALTATPSVDALERVVTDGAETITGLRRDGVIEVRGDAVRFVHPLFAEVVVDRATPAQRRAMHARLAELSDDPRSRTRHRALAADEPDAAVAAALALEAASDDRRGAPYAAAELMELACALTPPTDRTALAERRRQLAEFVLRSGDATEARRIVAEAVTEAPTGRALAELLELDARLLHVVGSPAEAAERCDRALALVDDPVVRARLHATRAAVEHLDVQEARRHARAALELLEGREQDEPASFALAVMTFAGSEFELGREIPFDLVNRGLECERESPNPSVGDRLSAALGTWLKYLGRLDEARPLLLEVLRSARDEGDEGSLPFAVSHLPQLELWAGNWSKAERWAEEHLVVAERTRQEGQRVSALYNLAQVHAHRGRFEEAQAALDAAFAGCEAIGDAWTMVPLCGTLGFLQLSMGRHHAAVEALRRSDELSRAFGRLRPRRDLQDYAEALVLVGEVEAAVEAAERLEDGSRKLDHSDLVAAALRCRAMVAVVEHDLDRAVALLADALTAHAHGSEPFSRGRTLLFQGQVLRRRGERRASVGALDEAEQVFTQLGAPTWAARASDERQRVPIRRRVAGGLTEAEERVAALAARGRTNREIADELFLSPKTVEANLTRVYTKLGVRSRSELAAMHAVGQPRGPGEFPDRDSANT